MVRTERIRGMTLSYRCRQINCYQRSYFLLRAVTSGSSYSAVPSTVMVLAAYNDNSTICISGAMVADAAQECSVQGVTAP